MGIGLLRQYIREFVAQPITRVSGRRDPHPSPLRWGNAVRPTAGGSVLDEEDGTTEEVQEDRGAACVLIVSEDGRVLAVSRKDNPIDFGLPGGKVDPGETPEAAARRELEEETGLSVGELDLVFVEHDGNMICRTFMGRAAGEIDTDESGVIRWVDPEVLLRGSFGDYNLRLFQKIGLM